MVDQGSAPEAERTQGQVQTDPESDTELGMDNMGNLRRHRSRDTREREQAPVTAGQEEPRSRQSQHPLPLGIAGWQSRLAQEKRQSQLDNHQGVRTTQGNLARDEVMQMFGDLKNQLVTMIQQT